MTSFWGYGILSLFLGVFHKQNMGVSKIRGTPKWMVKIMENPIKIDDLGVPLFLETPICWLKIETVEGYPLGMIGQE